MGTSKKKKILINKRYAIYEDTHGAFWLIFKSKKKYIYIFCFVYFNF